MVRGLATVLVRTQRLTVVCAFWNGIWGDGANKEDEMAQQQTVQQVVDFLKSHPEAARKAADYLRSHPNEVKEALRDVADERGWDLSNIDTTELKTQITKIAH